MDEGEREKAGWVPLAAADGSSAATDVDVRLSWTEFATLRAPGSEAGGAMRPAASGPVETQSFCIATADQSMSK